MANAGTSDGNPQTLLWVAVWVAAGVVLFLLFRILVPESWLQRVSTALRDWKTKKGASSETSRATQAMAAPPSQRPPYVEVVMEGSTQTESQTLRPLTDAGRAPARMPEGVRAGVIANLSRWLKQKMVQRLLSDRAQLLATQQAAALKVLEVDQRLAKVEQQIQRRNQEYEQRIDDLLNALITAREENRELIRAKIALIKAEMEKDLFETGQHSQDN